MLKPHSSLRHFNAVKTESTGTIRRKLSRNSEVATFAKPQAVWIFVSSSSRVIGLSLLPSLGCGAEVARRDDRVARRQLQGQRPRLAGFGAVLELARGERSGRFHPVLKVHDRPDQLLRP